MRTPLLLTLTLALAILANAIHADPTSTQPASQPTTSPAIDPKEAVVAAIEKLGGIIRREDKKPDGPIIYVQLFRAEKHDDVSDDLLLQISTLKSLRVLLLGKNPKITDAGVKHLKDLHELLSLSLFYTNLSDSGLEAVSELKNLHYLYLGDTKVTDAGMKHLKNLKQLVNLELRDIKLTDAGLEQLKDLENLEDLDLTGTQITGTGLIHLKDLKQLRALHLASTQITDDGLASLKDMTQLTDIRLTGTNITDKGLEHLHGLKNLTFLGLFFTKVTDPGAKKFQDAIPSLQNRTLSHG